MIAFSCPGCGQKLSVTDDLAGKTGTCPRCKQRMRVPAVAASHAANKSAAAAGPSNAPASADLAENVSLSPVLSMAMQAYTGGERLDFLGPPQGPDELGRLGPYRVLRLLGAGGMGMVLQAEDPLLKRSVALKVMRPELAVQPEARQRFLREAQATAAIEHPHVVTIHQVGEDRGVPFLAMPLLKGEPLDERLKREKKLPASEVVRLGRQIARGLAAAHMVGLIHRDVKPGNIWLEPTEGDGTSAPGCGVKILDFGLARAVAGDDGQLTKSGAIMGTPAYMAPEQARGEKVDGRCDLFSLGGMLYCMLTGEQTFKGDSTMALLMALATEEPRPVRELVPHAPPTLADLIERLLAKDPEKRPASAQAVADALAVMEENRTPALPSAAATTAWVEPGGKARPRWLLAVAGGGVLFVLLLWFFSPLDGKPTGKGDSPVEVAGKDGGKRPKEEPQPAEVVKGWAKEIENSIGMKLVRIPAGKFKMGSPADEKDREPREKGNEEQHEVEITKAFWLGAHEVTQKEFKAVMGYNPSYFAWEGEGKSGLNYRGKPAGGKDQVPADTSGFPVENVSYEEAVLFCNKLTALAAEKSNGRTYRLPTEAEWEYACRAGAASYQTFHFGNSLSSSQANFNGNFPYGEADKGDNLRRTRKVGSYKANGFGLYDMHGNVAELCSDWHAKDYGPSRSRNPVGPAEGSGRVSRGGSYHSFGKRCRSAYRSWRTPADRDRNLGFRVALVPSGQ